MGSITQNWLDLQKFRKIENCRNLNSKIIMLLWFFALKSCNVTLTNFNFRLKWGSELTICMPARGHHHHRFRGFRGRGPSRGDVELLDVPLEMDSPFEPRLLRRQERHHPMQDPSSVTFKEVTGNCTLSFSKYMTEQDDETGERLLRLSDMAFLHH